MIFICPTFGLSEKAAIGNNVLPREAASAAVNRGLIYFYTFYRFQWKEKADDWWKMVSSYSTIKLAFHLASSFIYRMDTEKKSALVESIFEEMEFSLLLLLSPHFFRGLNSFDGED